MRDALLTGELRVPRTDSRTMRIEAIERELRQVRHDIDADVLELRQMRADLPGLRGLSPPVIGERGRVLHHIWNLEDERDRLLQRRGELEEERRGLMEGK